MGCGIPTWVMNPALVYFGSVPFDDVYDVYDGMLGRLPGNRRGQKCRNLIGYSMTPPNLDDDHGRSVVVAERFVVLGRQAFWVGLD